MRQSARQFQVFVSLADCVTASGHRHVRDSVDWIPHDLFPDVFVVRCCGDRLRELCLEWNRSLNPADLEVIRCHVTTLDQEPTAGQLMHSRNLRWLLEWLNGRWLHDLLRSERLVTFFQPIVDLARRSRIFAFECLSRAQGWNGELIPPDQLFRAARATGQLASLDHAAQLTAVRTAARHKLNTCIFVNFSPRFLEHTAASLERTIITSINEGLPSDRLVFEVVESDKLQDFELLARVLRFCREAGSRVALDDVGAGYNSLSLMAEVRPDFIKIDRELIRGVDKDLFKCRVVSKLIELARDLEIATVVEGIESESEWEWAVNQGAEYAQGFLFGRPTPHPLEMMETGAPGLVPEGEASPDVQEVMP